MSLFIDVWTNQAFVLASDVRLILDTEISYCHKLAYSRDELPISCAIAVCGEYPQNCIEFFKRAINTKDTFRDIAFSFASQWTKRYGGIKEYSAVHLVGFENIADANLQIPQMWFWCNWAPNGFGEKRLFDNQLASFKEQIPRNNHIPHKMREMTGIFPAPTYESEAKLVHKFLIKYQPYFTWNGDNIYWRGVADAIGSAMKIVWNAKSNYSIQDIEKVAEECIKFMVNIGSLLDNSTIGLSPTASCDVLTVTPHGVKKIKWAKLDTKTTDIDFER